MKTKKTFLFLMMGASMLGACVSEDHDLAPNQTETVAAKKGRLTVNLNSNARFDAATRALIEANYRNTNNYTVKITKTGAETPVLTCLGSELSSKLPKELAMGTYTATAFYGTESKASRDDFRVEGSSNFEIKADQNTSVTVNCAPTCGKISVAFDNEMATYYDDYSVSFDGTQALGTETISWAKADTEPWYVAIGTNAETVKYTITLKAKSDYAITDADGNKQTTGIVTGTFSLERNKAQKLTVKPNYVAPAEGGISITITIDDSVNERNETITVPVSWI